LKDGLKSVRRNRVAANCSALYSTSALDPSKLKLQVKKNLKRGQIERPKSATLILTTSLLTFFVKKAHEFSSLFKLRSVLNSFVACLRGSKP